MEKQLNGMNVGIFVFWMDEEMLKLVGGHMSKKVGFSKEDKRGKFGAGRVKA